MKNKQLLEYLNILKEMDNLDLGVKFGYAVAKNFEKVQECAEIVNKMLNKRPDGWRNYEKERQLIFDEVAEKNENDVPIKSPVEGGGFSYKINDWGLLDKKLEELRQSERFKVMLDEQEKKTKELEELLESEADKFEWYAVKAKYIPNTLKGKFYRVVVHMVSQDEIDQLSDFVDDKESKKR